MRTKVITSNGYNKEDYPHHGNMFLVGNGAMGVLVTTDELHYRAWKQLANEEGIKGFAREDNLRQRGVSRMASLEVVLEKTDKTYSAEEKLALAERKNKIYVDSLANLDKSAVLDGVFEFIDYIKSKGIKTAVGAAKGNAQADYRANGLRDKETVKMIVEGF